MKSGMEKINNICKHIVSLTENDFKQANAVITGQLKYSHPLKHKTAREQHNLGIFNQTVTNELYLLYKTLVSGQREED